MEWKTEIIPFINKSLHFHNKVSLSLNQYRQFITQSMPSVYHSISNVLIFSFLQLNLCIKSCNQSYSYLPQNDYSRCHEAERPI